MLVQFMDMREGWPRMARFLALLAVVVGLAKIETIAAEPAQPRELLMPSLAPTRDSEAAESIETSPPPQPEFRPLAVIAEEAENASPLTPNIPISDTMLTPIPPDTYPERVVVEGDNITEPCEAFSDGDSCSMFWSDKLVYTVLPRSLLWEPPMANQREPRMYGKLDNANEESTIDTAIGGEFGVARFGPADRLHEGIQLDVFAAVFTRFNEQRLLKTADYRVGIPLTYAKGPWEAKVAYEHTSTHLGDEYIEATGRRQVPHVRDEIVFGLARRFWNQVRFYGQYGYSFSTSNAIQGMRDRYDVGVEWSKQRNTGWKGQPFAAADFDIRSDQDYQVNTTLQIGWQWLDCVTRHSARLAMEVYTGRNPYGQFYQEYDDWIGVGAYYDW